MFAAAEIESLFAAPLFAFVTLQTGGRSFSRRHFLERNHLGGGGLGGVVHQGGRLVFFACLVQLLYTQIKVHVTAGWAMTSFAASFVDWGISQVGFAMRRESVMTRLGGMAFRAGFGAYVLAGVRGLPLLRLR